MKIYIETEMTELPRNCAVCPKHERSRTMSFLCYCKEGETYRHWNEAQNNRAKWCPLRTETEIADKKENGNGQVR